MHKLIVHAQLMRSHALLQTGSIAQATYLCSQCFLFFIGIFFIFRRESRMRDADWLETQSATVEVALHILLSSNDNVLFVYLFKT